MWSFLAEFVGDVDDAYTILVMDEECREHPRRYVVRPRHLWMLVGTSVTLLATGLLCLVVLTPLREVVPGYGTAELRRDARLAALRVATLEDSLETRREYMEHLRQVLMGEVRPAPQEGEDNASAPEPAFSVTGELAEVAPDPVSEHWEDHVQPAVPIEHMPLDVPEGVPVASSPETYVPSLPVPALWPVQGFLTRRFDARTGHFAIDIAVEEGTMVRSIGDGYVIFADWTHEGGYALAVQHADGYVSIYKHNKRLLKRVGDRVRAREAVAVSGNSGEVTTGPHLHFELWRDGLAQDPRAYLVGPQ